MVTLFALKMHIPEAMAVAKFVIPANGGSGVVREFLNYIRKREEA